MPRKRKKADLQFANLGSIWLMRPITPAAFDWIADHINPEESTSLGGAIAVDPRYVADLAFNAENDGLTVEGRS